MSAFKYMDVHVHLSFDSEELLPEFNIGVKETWSKDDSSYSTHGNLHLIHTTDHNRRGRLLTNGRNYARRLSLQYASGRGHHEDA